MFAFGPIPAALPSSGSAPPDECLGPPSAFQASLLRAGALVASAAMLAGFASQLRGASTADGIPTAPPPIVDEIYYQRPVIQPPIWTVRHQTPWNDELAIATIVVPGRGPAGVGAFVLNAEDGGQVTYSWQTDILPSYDGQESRISLIGCPREAYKFTARLTDGQWAALQSLIARYAAAAPAFTLALGYESLLLTSGSAFVANVPTTLLSDWCYPGARCVVVAPSGAWVTGVVQAVTATSITLDSNIGAVALPYARIMPMAPVYLEDTQSVQLYAMNVGDYELAARGILFGNATSDWSSAGGAVTTFASTVGIRGAYTYPVWDRGIDTDATSGRSLIGGTTFLDYHAALQNIGPRLAVDVGRTLRTTLEIDADRQWLKAFLGAVVGRRKPFLLPTYKPDLLAVTGAAVGSALTVYGPPTANVADYVGAYFASDSHKRLALFMADGSVTYVDVTDCTDNGNGTQTLQLGSGAPGAIVKVSFLELCRLDTDDVVITWADGIGRMEIAARVVQQ